MYMKGERDRERWNNTQAGGTGGWFSAPIRDLWRSSTRASPHFSFSFRAMLCSSTAVCFLYENHHCLYQLYVFSKRSCILIVSCVHTVPQVFIIQFLAVLKMEALVLWLHLLRINFSRSEDQAQDARVMLSNNISRYRPGAALY